MVDRSIRLIVWRLHQPQHFVYRLWRNILRIGYVDDEAAIDATDSELGCRRKNRRDRGTVAVEPDSEDAVVLVELLLYRAQGSGESLIIAGSGIDRLAE